MLPRVTYPPCCPVFPLPRVAPSRPSTCSRHGLHSGNGNAPLSFMWIALRDACDPVCQQVEGVVRRVTLAGARTCSPPPLLRSSPLTCRLLAPLRHTAVSTTLLHTWAATLSQKRKNCTPRYKFPGNMRHYCELMTFPWRHYGLVPRGVTVRAAN